MNMRQKLKVSNGFKFATSSVVALIIFLVIMIAIGAINLRRINNEIDKKNIELKNIEDKYLILKAAYVATENEYIQYVQNFNTLISERTDEIIELKEKYNKCLTISNKQDFTLKDLIYLNQICKEYDIPVSLMLAIYEKESTFYSLAKNPTSNATGYGQLIPSTAKSIYENYLKEGSYDISRHYELASNKELNIRLSCRLMKYNIDSYGDYWTATERYFGHKDASKRYAYASDINKKMSKYGESLK